TVYDSVLHEYVTDKLTFPVSPPVNEEPLSGSVKVTAQADIRGGAAASAPVIGVAAPGTAYKLTGIGNGFYRVEVEPGRPGFIAQAAAVKSDQSATKLAQFTPVWQVDPPRLEIKRAASLVDSTHFRLQGVAKDDQKVADIYVFVSNRQAKI